MYRTEDADQGALKNEKTNFVVDVFFIIGKKFKPNCSRKKT